jgi:colanic acid biosynthesis glycosyl transferase WcaI
LAEIISQVGVLVPPDDSAALADAICCLAHQPGLRSELAAKGRRYVEAHWSKKQVLANVLYAIESLSYDRLA